MLAELTSHRLEVILTPSRRAEVAEQGGMIRVILDRNADWYRRMCEDHPSTRTRKKTSSDTKIKRQDTITALEHMLRNGWAQGFYQLTILRYIPGFMADLKKQQEAHKQEAYRQKLEKRKEARRKRVEKIDDTEDTGVPF